MFLVFLNLLTALFAGGAAYFYFAAGSVVFGWIWVIIALMWVACAVINYKTHSVRTSAERLRREISNYNYAHMFDGYRSWVDLARDERSGR